VAPPLALIIALAGGAGAKAEPLAWAEPALPVSGTAAVGFGSVGFGSGGSGSGGAAGPVAPSAAVAAAAAEPAAAAAILAAIRRYSDPLPEELENPGTLQAAAAPPPAEASPGLQERLAEIQERVALLEARRFVPTTTLKGLVSSVLGANRYSGNSLGGAAAANQESGGFTFNNELELNLKTSFNANDLLSMVLRVGNFGNTPFGGYGVSGDLSSLEVAFEKSCQYGDCDEVLSIDRLSYRWPVGAGFTALLGARIAQEDALPFMPFFYKANPVLNVSSANGAPAAWNLSEGAGGGLWWQQHPKHQDKPQGLSIGASYIAANGEGFAAYDPGIGTAESGGSGSIQVGYTNASFQLAAIWTRLQKGAGSAGATVFSAGQLEDVVSDAFGLAGSWQPATSGWLPSVSLGWGYNRSHPQPPLEPGRLIASQSWQVGLQWQGAPAPGHGFGFALGQPVFATALSGGRRPDDGGVILEGWYQLQVSDAISVAPAVFWLSRPLGMDTPDGGRLGQLGALLRVDIVLGALPDD